MSQFDVSYPRTDWFLRNSKKETCGSLHLLIHPFGDMKYGFGKKEWVHRENEKDESGEKIRGMKDDENMREKEEDRIKRGGKWRER